MKKIILANVWSDPRTGRCYVRRQIPAALRPAFGGRAIYKKALGTRDPAEARSAFARENAVFEGQLAHARKTLAGGVRASPDAVVRRWFDSPPVGNGLAGRQRLLLALMQLDAKVVEWWAEDCRPEDRVAPIETDWDGVERDRDAFDGLFATHYRDDVNRIGIAWESMRMDTNLNNVCRDFLTILLPRLRSFDIEAVAHSEASLTGALLVRLDVERSGKLEDMEQRPLMADERKRVSRLRPTMRMRELFREWKAGNRPRAQTALEYEVAMEDFVEFAGDPAIAAIDADLIYDYRDAAARLPASMPRADRALPFRNRVARHAQSEPKTSAATLKKRVGAVQALLTYAFQQRWIGDNSGRGVQIVGYTKSRRNRRSFEDQELATLFAAPLFVDRSSWREGALRDADDALFWIFLLALTSGARLEEVGQAAIADVRQDGEIVYLDIDEYALADDVADKHVKTADSVRLVPVHQRLIDLGFLQYRDAVLAAGHASLFPALKENCVGKRTKELSRRANRLIDRQVSMDERLVFHSLRHTFKAKGHDAGLSDRTLDQLCGHAPISTGGRYGSEPRVRTIHRELHQIDFACVNWESIARRSSSNSHSEARDQPCCVTA